MKRCKYCNVDVDTEKSFCPVCFNHLETISEQSDCLYTPRTKNETTAKTGLFLTKLFLFISIVAIAVCTTVNYMTTPSVGWFWLVVWGIIYLWVLVAHTILSKRSAFRKIVLQVVTIVVLLYFAEKLSLRLWLISYVYPGIGLCVIVVLSMISFISEKRSKLCLGFSLVIFLLGMGSLIILLSGWDKFALLNKINLITCAVVLLGYILFGFTSMKNEIIKKWHL